MGFCAFGALPARVASQVQDLSPLSSHFARAKTLTIVLGAWILLLLGSTALAQTNLIPNGSFTSKPALDTWRTDFPYESWYAENVKYVRVDNDPKKGPCATIDLPPGIAGNQGGKIESAFVKAEPGATYRVDIDCKTIDFSAKLHAEAWTTDPKPDAKRDKFRIPAVGTMPALVMCCRAQIPDPPAKSSEWITVGRKFTLPKSVKVAGLELKPEYLSLKVVVYAATQGGGKSQFTNFRLIRVE